MPHHVELLDDEGEPIEVVSGFLRFLAARNLSPNTMVSYAYDLRHLWRFFAERDLSWDRFGPRTRSYCWSTCGPSPRAAPDSACR